MICEEFLNPKIITGVGLILDLIGVTMLLVNEIYRRQGDIYQEQDLEENTYEDIFNESLKENPVYKETQSGKRAKENRKKLSLKSSQRISLTAMVIICLGFLFQIVSLFLN